MMNYDTNLTTYESCMTRLRLIELCIKDDELKKWAREEAKILMDDLKQREAFKQLNK